jgi:proteasome lid subunit RPN8/RPN11
MVCTKTACGEPRDSYQLSQAVMRIDETTKLIVHTHSPVVNPTPSYADIKLAERTGIPDLVVSAYAMYIVWPDGKIEEVKY